MRYAISFLLLTLSLAFACNSPDDEAIPESLPILQLSHPSKYSSPLDWHPYLSFRHPPHYFGEGADTLEVLHSAWPVPPPPPPPSSEDTSYDWRFEEQPFADYFAHEPHSTEFREADSAELWLRIDTSQVLPLYSHQAYPIFVRNQSADTLQVGYGESSYLILQTQIKSGEWRDLEERASYFCGTGLYPMLLPPHELLVSSTPLYEGDTLCRLRLRMGKNYSNAYWGRVERAMFGE